MKLFTCIPGCMPARQNSTRKWPWSQKSWS